jgi:hypothetical protein
MRTSWTERAALTRRAVRDLDDRCRVSYSLIVSEDAQGSAPLADARGGRGRSIALYGAFALAALAVVTVRVVLDSRAALRAGEDAERRGEAAEASRHYLHAVRMYAPGSPYVGRALDRLEAQAATAAKNGDNAAERRALEAVRAGLLGARSLYTAHADRLQAADRRLAALYAAGEDPAVAPGATLAEREAWHKERLERRPGPATLPAVAALVGFALWLGAVVVFVRRGLDRSLRLQPRWALLSVIGFFAGFALFLVGLRLA